MNVIELFPPASTEALKQSALDVQVASAMPGEVNFFAAHGEEVSYAVLVDKRWSKEGLTVWELSGGSKAARQLRAQNVRNKYGAGGE
jgi:hypothetical protein